MTGLEKRLFDKKDFARTENYNICIRPTGVKKLISELSNQFSMKVQYQKASHEWSCVVFLKARELAHHIAGKRKSLCFSSPDSELKREDNLKLRREILNMSYSEWKRMGYSKGTLYYLRKRVGEERPFKSYSKSRNKILNFQSSASSIDFSQSRNSKTHQCIETFLDSDGLS
jgi:CRISPR-associated protein Cas1